MGATGGERDPDSQLSSLVGNACSAMRIQPIVSGRQEAITMWAKQALVKISERVIRLWRKISEKDDLCLIYVFLCLNAVNM